ncbi:MAG: BamA/TamA family outer membrane protein, partial [Candidatus Latescibacterota bacterium]
MQGNEALSGGELRALMNTRQSPWYSFLPWVGGRLWDPDVLQDDLDRIQRRYRELGFRSVELDTSLHSSGPQAVRLRLRVREGPQTRVAAIALTGLDTARIDSAEVASELVLQRGDGLVLEKVALDRQTVRGYLTEHGYPYARVAARLDVTPDAPVARLTYAVTPGPRCRIGQIEVTGNDLVDSSVVRQALTFRSGDLFRQSRLLATQQQLYRSGAFRSVILQPPDSAAQESPVDILVYVRERSPRRLRLGLSLSTGERARGVATWQHRNFLGGARQLSAQSDASFLQQRVRLSLDQPYVGDPWTWLTVGSFVEREDQPGYDVKRTGGEATLTRTFGRHTDVHLSGRGEYTDYNLAAAFTVFRLEVRRDARNDYFSPSGGHLLAAAVEESGWLLGSDRELLKLSGEGRWYARLPLLTTAAARLAAGALWKVSEGAPAPDFRRFYSGGPNSVRGWDLNELGPRTASGGLAGGGRMPGASGTCPRPLLQKRRRTPARRGGSPWRCAWRAPSCGA